MLQSGGTVTGREQQSHRLLTARIIFLRIVVNGRAVGVPEGAAVRRNDAVGDQTVRGTVFAAHCFRQRVPVHHHGHGLPHRLAETGGHLIDQHSTDSGRGGLHRPLHVSGIQHKVHIPGVIQRHGILTAAGIPELQHVGAKAAGIIIPLRSSSAQPLLRHAGHRIRAVGQQRSRVHGPILHRLRFLIRLLGLGLFLRLRRRRNIGPHRHGGHRRADHGKEIGAMAADGHHKGTVIAGRHLQRRGIAGYRVGIAGHHIEDGGMGRRSGRVHQPLPGIHKVISRDPFAIRPVNIIAQRKGIRLRTVHIVGIFITGSLRAYNAGCGLLHQVFKQVDRHGLFRLGDGEGRVQRNRRIDQRCAHCHLLRFCAGASRHSQHRAQRQRQCQ